MAAVVLRALTKACLSTALLAAPVAANEEDRQYCAIPWFQPKLLRGISGVRQISASPGNEAILGLRREGTILFPFLAGPSTGGITSVANGRAHAAAITVDGIVVAWGDGKYAQTGYRYNEIDIIEAGVQRVPPLTEVVALAAGETHTLALRKDGKVWAWGGNDFGQLGSWAGTHGESEQLPPAWNATWPSYPISSPPRPVLALTQVIAIGAGARYSLALKKDGTVWRWGNQSRLHSPGGAWGADYYAFARTRGLFDPTPRKIEGLPRIVAISAGYQHAMAVAADGTLWAWGLNNCGQLGVQRVHHAERVPKNVPPLVDPSYEETPREVSGLGGVKAVSAGAHHTLALTRDGKVWAWGSRRYGRLGLNDATDLAEGDGKCEGLVNVRSMRDLAPYHFTPRPVAGVVDAQAIGAGETYSMALDRRGRIVVWGMCAGCPGQLRASYDQDKPCDAHFHTPRVSRPARK